MRSVQRPAQPPPRDSRCTRALPAVTVTCLYKGLFSLDTNCFRLVKTQTAAWDWHASSLRLKLHLGNFFSPGWKSETACSKSKGRLRHFILLSVKHNRKEEKPQAQNWIWLKPLTTNTGRKTSTESPLMNIYCASGQHTFVHVIKDLVTQQQRELVNLTSCTVYVLYDEATGRLPLLQVENLFRYFLKWVTTNCECFMTCQVLLKPAAGRVRFRVRILVAFRHLYFFFAPIILDDFIVFNAFKALLKYDLSHFVDTLCTKSAKEMMQQNHFASFPHMAE